MNDRPTGLAPAALRRVRTAVGVVLGSRRYLTEARAARPRRRRNSPEHAMRIGAAQIGVPFETYRDRTAAGEKWCAGHKAWHPRALFGTDRSTGDGLSYRCLEAARAQRAAWRLAHG